MQIADGFAGKDSKVKTTHSIQILQKAMVNSGVNKEKLDMNEE
jgi:hypothetical protein